MIDKPDAKQSAGTPTDGEERPRRHMRVRVFLVAVRIIEVVGRLIGCIFDEA